MSSHLPDNKFIVEYFACNLEMFLLVEGNLLQQLNNWKKIEFAVYGSYMLNH